MIELIPTMAMADRKVVGEMMQKHDDLQSRLKPEIVKAVCMTCQICGRYDLQAGRGKISHHNFKRPGDGYTYGGCFGAGHPPFEISRDALPMYVNAMKRQRESAEYMLEVHAARDPTISITRRTRRGLGYYSANVSRENFGLHRAKAENAGLGYYWPKTYDEAKRDEIKALRFIANTSGKSVEYAERRYATWKPKVADLGRSTH